MEDDNGLELSLGLSFGGPSSKQKGKSISSDIRTEEGYSGSKIVSDFKNFLNAGTPRHESRPATPSDSGKPPENFFNALSGAPSGAGGAINFGGRNLWTSENYRAGEADEGKGSENSHKRGRLSDEMNSQKRHEKESHDDIQGRNRTPIISISTEEGSTADNEDVADSEIEGSTSRVVSHHDRSKRSTPEFPQEIHGFPEGRSLDVQGQRRLNNSSENEFKLGNSGFSAPFPAQSMNMINGSHQIHGKESSNPSAPTMSGHSLPGLMQVMNAANGERLEAQPVIPANSQLMFGYSPVQLPTLNKDNSWQFGSHAQRAVSLFAGRVSQNSDRHGDILPQAHGLPRSLSELTPRDSRLLEQSSNNGKHGIEGGSSSQNEEPAPGSSRGNNIASDRSTAEEGLSLDLSAIKPGIAADLKLGGCGSCPNLPWVSTTAPGPNGRTISGVTYRYSPNQIKIVCACHGSHMSPEEFVRHAAEDNANPENSSGLSSLPSKNPAASAQS